MNKNQRQTQNIEISLDSSISPSIDPEKKSGWGTYYQHPEVDLFPPKEDIEDQYDFYYNVEGGNKLRFHKVKDIPHFKEDKYYGEIQGSITDIVIGIGTHEEIVLRAKELDLTNVDDS